MLGGGDVESPTDSVTQQRVALLTLTPIQNSTHHELRIATLHSLPPATHSAHPENNLQTIPNFQAHSHMYNDSSSHESL